MRIRLYSGLAGIDALAEDWRALFDRLERPSYLHLWEWHRSYLEAEVFDPQSVIFCAVHHGDRLVAVLPLVRKAMHLLGLPLRLLDLPFHPLVPHADILVEPSALAGVSLPGLLRALHDELGEPWDSVRLGLTLADSSASAMLRRTHGLRDRMLVARHQPDQSNALRIAPYGDMLARFSKNLRKGLRKSRDSLAKLEGVKVCWARRPDELAEAFPRFLAVEASGWKGKLGTALQCDPRLLALYSNVVRHLGPSGRCRINLLLHGERVIAGQFGIAVGDRFHMLKIGYDELYKDASPSNMLLERLLQKLAEEPEIRYLDLISDQGWHRGWRPEQRPVLMLYVCRPTPRGALIWAAMQGRKAVRALAKGGSPQSADG